IIHLARTNPKAAKKFIELTLKVASNDPDSYFNSIKDHLPDSDCTQLETNQLQQDLTQAFNIASQQGFDAIGKELLFILKDWQLSAASINCPVNIWHGNKDNHISIENIKLFSQGFSNTVKHQWIDGQGHYLLFSHWHKILEDIAS
ncbi:MAG: alpha/beta hydrolase, partial [Mariprofundus sp.]|nr:alpha/beta hydrolase [Mariprofundus sp.]